jgi:hypothetical protein
MATHDVTNSQNLQALIDHIRAPNRKTNQLAYAQAGRFVLLGKGHSQTDTAQIRPNDRYEGTLSLSINNTQLTMLIEGYLIQSGDKEWQISGRNELEGAIQQALSGTNCVPTFHWIEPQPH